MRPVDEIRPRRFLFSQSCETRIRSIDACRKITLASDAMCFQGCQGFQSTVRSGAARQSDRPWEADVALLALKCVAGSWEYSWNWEARMSGSEDVAAGGAEGEGTSNFFTPRPRILGRREIEEGQSILISASPSGESGAGRNRSEGRGAHYVEPTIYRVKLA
ncbi:hypothetical protein KM043_002852 [Ampulex compressa]|nr:hypothetical protein KM043_002852 [Ampulex compressa]